MNLQKKLLNEVCNICEGKGLVPIELDGVVRYKSCKCVIERKKERVMGFFKDCRFENTTPRNEIQRKLYELMMNEPLSSYFIFGNVRTGKTHFAACLYNHIFDNFTEKILWINDRELKRSFRRAELDMNEVDIIEDIRNRNLLYLFLDDLGKVIPSDFVLQEYYRLIDEIYVHRCGLCITSIFSIKELAKIYGISITRRIEDICNYIVHLK